LDYFINDEHIKDRVVSVLKDVYFGVWLFICYLFLFIYLKIFWFKIIITLIIFLIFVFIFFRLMEIEPSTFIKYYLFQTISTPTLLDDLKEYNEYRWVI
jgi:hypothetical protein